MEALEIKTIFTLFLFGRAVPITETVIISWLVMVILIVASIILAGRLREIPAGPQAILETGVEFLNNFAKNQFGRFAKILGPYIGTVFLFLLLSNIIGLLSPVEMKIAGHEFIPPFTIRPPTRDLNVTAALAAISIILVLVFGFAARGIGGWFKNLLHPMPVMLPFNLLDYGTRFLSLSLRLYGNILAGFVLMGMIEKLLPVGLPAICSLYFDIFDGLLQAGIFVFLTVIYIAEAVKINED
ncbi:MAG: F0F1 ATP synthase subunit A [Treponema sp.]|nr:F0F1 ATP synthase subunit A [Treponema sp.]